MEPTIKEPTREELISKINDFIQHKNISGMIYLTTYYKNRPEETLILGMVSEWLHHLVTVCDLPELSDLATLFAVTVFHDEYQLVCEKIKNKIEFRVHNVNSHFDQWEQAEKGY